MGGPQRFTAPIQMRRSRAADWEAWQEFSSPEDSPTTPIWRRRRNTDSDVRRALRSKLEYK